MKEQEWALSKTQESLLEKSEISQWDLIQLFQKASKEPKVTTRL